MSFRHKLVLRQPTSTEAVDDACLLRAGNSIAIILGHVRNYDQVTLCRINRNVRTPTLSRPVCLILPKTASTQTLDRPFTESKKGGVSAMTNIEDQSLSFATGGYDHLVHLWDVQDDLISATCQPLAIKHTAQVQSLLSIHDTSRKLISASSDCNAHIWDLSSERVVNTLKASNSIFHLHKTRFPHCTLLEVRISSPENDLY